MAVQLGSAFVLGRIMLPFFRKIKTGKLEFYMGDRFRQDGSEPKFGGICSACVFCIGIFPALSLADYLDGIGSDNGSIVYRGGAVYCIFLLIMGIYEDYAKEKGRALGLKNRHKIILEFIASLFFLLFIKICGYASTAVLFPFRIGYVEFGAFYYPVMAGLMTLGVNLVKIHDCFGGDTSSGVDGLCWVTASLYGLIGAVCSDIMGNTCGEVFGYCIAGMSAGMLIWGLSPSKLYSGESGGLFLGGIVSVFAVLSGIQLVFLFAGIAYVIDGICSGAQYLVYKKRKKLLFKGNSLHAHLKACGLSDYNIMGLSAVCTAVGGGMAIAFAVYSTKF